MAEALKSFFSPSLIRQIAKSITAISPSFPEKAFVRDASKGLEALELLARARHISEMLRRHLPEDYEKAVSLLLRSLGPEHASDELEGAGMAPFFYLPHVMFVGTYGLDHFELSMRAQHELTRRFTCEFSIRPFLERHEKATLAVLRTWATDPNPHVRRLVSEGTRPRLPWAPRVRWIEEHPERVLPLLEKLKDDPASVVRRSVANHLNDLSKSNATLVCDIAERWLKNASDDRAALVRHALRSAVKKGDRRALSLLGFGEAARVKIGATTIVPARVAIGRGTRVSFVVQSIAKRPQTLAIDLIVHFVKASGKSSPKVFKVGRTTLAGGAKAALEKKISLAIHTTRKPYPGRHAVEALINGARFPLGSFVVTSAS